MTSPEGFPSQVVAPRCLCGSVRPHLKTPACWPGIPPARPHDEERVVHSTTGGAKGSKLSQLAWAPPGSLEELGNVYGFGCTKYDPTNYRKGYKWSLSVNAMLRHVFAWLGGESKDPESGRHHLAHAAWHCLALMFFEKHYPQFDDVRWFGNSQPGSGAESEETQSPESSPGTPRSSNA